MGWFKEWLAERRRVKMKRVEVGSIPRVWLGTLAILLGLVAVALVCAAYMISHALDGMAQSSAATVTALGGVGEQVSKGLSDVIVENPEVGIFGLGAAMDYDTETTFKMTSLSIAKQLSASADADVQGHIAGHFGSKDIRWLEKVNLSCLDAYDYYELNSSRPTFPRDMEIAKDRGGNKYAEINETVFIVGDHLKT